MEKQLDSLSVRLVKRGFFPVGVLLWALFVDPFLSSVPYYVVYNLAPPTIIGSSRVYYRILSNPMELIDVVGLDVNYFILIGLVFLIAIQMINPWHAHPFLDLGVNLIVSALITLAWYTYLSAIIVTIPQWDPRVIITTPLISMSVVPLHRIVLPFVWKTLPREPPTS